MNALENEDEGDSDCFVASKWYMVGGFYWKKQDTAVIAPNTYGTLYRNTLDGEWRVARVLEDQHSLEVERMVGGKKVKRPLVWTISTLGILHGLPTFPTVCHFLWPWHS